MQPGLETIHRLKREYADISKLIAKEEKNIKKLRKDESLYAIDYAERRLRSMRDQLAEVERRMTKSWQVEE